MILVTKENVYINCYNICTVGPIESQTSNQKTYGLAVNGQAIMFETIDERDTCLNEIQQYLKIHGSTQEGVKYI